MENTASPCNSPLTQRSRSKPGNKKSAVLVAALCEYLQAHPALQNPACKTELKATHSYPLEALAELVREMVGEQLAQAYHQGMSGLFRSLRSDGVLGRKEHTTYDKSTERDELGGRFTKSMAAMHVIQNGCSAKKVDYIRHNQTILIFEVIS